MFSRFSKIEWKSITLRLRQAVAAPGAERINVRKSAAKRLIRRLKGEFLNNVIAVDLHATTQRVFHNEPTVDPSLDSPFSSDYETTTLEAGESSSDDDEGGSSSDDEEGAPAGGAPVAGAPAGGAPVGVAPQ